MAEIAETQDLPYPETLGIEGRTDVSLRLASAADSGELTALLSANRGHLEAFGHLEIGEVTPEKTESAIKEMLEHMHQGSYLQYRIISNDKIVGSVTLYDLGQWEGVAKFGCWIGKEAEGKGYASAASRRLVQYGFDDLGLQRVLFEISPENTRSEQLAQHAGARLISDVVTETEEDGRQLTYRVWEINERP